MAVLVVLLSGVTRLSAGGEPTTRVIELTARQFSYEPNIIEVNRGDRVVIKLRTDDVAHGLFIDGYEIKTEVLPGEEKVLEFTADKPGRFMFRCSHTCGPFHPYMVGWLRVRPNIFLNLALTGTAAISAGVIAYLWIGSRGRPTL